MPERVSGSICGASVPPAVFATGNERNVRRRDAGATKAYAFPRSTNLAKKGRFVFVIVWRCCHESRMRR
jgi:hypothetical protein